MTPTATSSETHLETHSAIPAILAKLERYEELIRSLEKELERYEARVRSLEDDRLKVKAWAALIVFSGSVGAFLLGHFWPK